MHFYIKVQNDGIIGDNGIHPIFDLRFNEYELSHVCVSCCTARISEIIFPWYIISICLHAFLDENIFNET